MHIENNVFGNIFNTVMDVKGKTNDNIEAKINITFFYHRKNIKLVYVGSRVVNTKANITLDNNA